MAGDVPVWPDNMALMTVKGGCLQKFTQEKRISLLLLGVRMLTLKLILILSSSNFSSFQISLIYYTIFFQNDDF